MTSTIKSSLPKLVKRNAYDLVMFGFIQGIRFNFSGISIDTAIGFFRKAYNLTEEDLNTETARTTYSRMQTEYLDSLKKPKE